MEKNKKNLKQEDPDIVRLPVLFGVKPGKYLAGLYSFIILSGLFFLLVFPGLSNPGGRLLVRTTPEGAAVRVDDVYAGSAPCPVFVPAGKHTVTIVMEGFRPEDREIEVKGRIFASLFAPETLEINTGLRESSPLAALKAGAADYAGRTFAGEPTEAYQIPLSLSEGVYRSAPRNIEDALPVLREAARFMVTKAALKDLSRAVFLAGNGGNAASPAGSLAAAGKILDYMDENRAFAVALTDISGEEVSKKLLESEFYPEVWSDSPASGVTGSSANGASAGKDIELSFSRYPFSIENIDFSPEFLPASYIQNTAFQHRAETGAFFISLDEITEAQFARFLNENPGWGRGNLEALIKAGHADEDYLLLPEDGSYPRPSQGAVSFYAARAFCEWLTGKLPASLGSYKVRLPYETEWEYAAKFAAAYFKNAAFPGGALKNMGSGLWEWCGDSFVPLNYLKGPADGELLELSPERGVRGGSWANAPGEVIPETRASLPPSACSPFAGFRVVLVRK